MDLEKMYNEYFPKIYSFVFYKLMQKEQTEEIVSTVFLKVVEKIDSFDETKASFNTWIYRIAQNTVIDYFRTKKDYTPIEDSESYLPPVVVEHEKSIIRDESRRALFEALAKLDMRTREIIALKYFGEMTVRDISEQLNLKESTVSSIHVRGLKKLKALLRDDYFK